MYDEHNNRNNINTGECFISVGEDTREDCTF